MWYNTMSFNVEYLVIIVLVQSQISFSLRTENILFAVISVNELISMVKHATLPPRMEQSSFCDVMYAEVCRVYQFDPLAMVFCAKERVRQEKGRGGVVREKEGWEEGKIGGWADDAKVNCKGVNHSLKPEVLKCSVIKARDCCSIKALGPKCTGIPGINERGSFKLCKTRQCEACNGPSTTQWSTGARQSMFCFMHWSNTQYSLLDNTHSFIPGITVYFGPYINNGWDVKFMSHL